MKNRCMAKNLFSQRPGISPQRLLQNPDSVYMGDRHIDTIRRILLSRRTDIRRSPGIDVASSETNHSLSHGVTKRKLSCDAKDRILMQSERRL